MFDWVFEGQLQIYLLLAVIALALAALWLRDRRMTWVLIGSCVVSGIVLYALLDWLVETRNEQIGRKLDDMSAAVKRRDAERIFRHIATRFQMGNQNRDEFRQAVEQALKSGLVTDIKLWSYDFSEGPGKVKFLAKPSGNTLGTEQHWLVRAQFVEENKNDWRMVGFEVYNPFVNTDRPVSIPNWPR